MTITQHWSTLLGRGGDEVFIAGDSEINPSQPVTIVADL